MDVGGFITILTLISAFGVVLWIDLLHLEDEKPRIVGLRLWTKKGAPCSISEIVADHLVADRLLRLYYEELEYGTRLAAIYLVLYLLFIVLPTFVVHLFTDFLKTGQIGGLSYLSIAQALLLFSCIAVTILLYQSLRFRKIMLKRSMAS